MHDSAEITPQGQDLCTAGNMGFITQWLVVVRGGFYTSTRNPCRTVGREGGRVIYSKPILKTLKTLENLKTLKTLNTHPSPRNRLQGVENAVSTLFDNTVASFEACGRGSLYCRGVCIGGLRVGALLFSQLPRYCCTQ